MNNIHLIEHAKANDVSATQAHVETHKRAWLDKRRNPELAPPGQVLSSNVPIDQQAGQSPPSVAPGVTWLPQDPPCQKG